VTIGLTTLELARIHKELLTTLKMPGDAKMDLKHAERFFNAANHEIAKTPQANRRSKIDLTDLKKKLDRRTLELAAANRKLSHSIGKRKGVQFALKKSNEHYAGLLKESQQLQNKLRRLTRRVMASQENERQKISTGLRDEIAQTLLGINVRLIYLKEQAHNNSKGLKREINTTQRLVARSARSVDRVAREFSTL
jgi:signal transduction histidine kinase